MPSWWFGLIEELVREGAQRMLAGANGSHRPREVLTWAGAVDVTVPRVNDCCTDPDTGQRQRFRSAILPHCCRKTPKITEVPPLLYLHGLSSGDFVPALGEFLGIWPGRTLRYGAESDVPLESNRPLVVLREITEENRTAVVGAVGGVKAEAITQSLAHS